MPTTANYGWTIPADTDLVKDGASAIRTLGNAIDTTAAASFGGSFKKISTTSFSAVSSIALPNNTFTSTYQNYKVMYVFGTSGTMTHTLRLRASGTDATGTNYNTKGILSGTTAVTNINNASATSWLGFSNVGAVIILLDILRPNEAKTTMGFGIHYADGTGDSRPISLDHSLASAYDSLNLICSTGTITGDVRVYGYQN